MSNLTPELVKQFYAEATKHFGAAVVDKEDSEMMKLVSMFLDTIGVLDKEDFMKSYTTTLMETIYIPFDVGVSSDYSLEEQVDILVHELVHVVQCQQGELVFALGYLCNKSSRANYEAEAYSADMEMHYWRTGEIYDIKSRAQLLENYAVNQRHIDFVVSFMESISITIQEGAVVNDVAAWAMDWMEQHGIQGAPSNNRID